MSSAEAARRMKERAVKLRSGAEADADYYGEPVNTPSERTVVEINLQDIPHTLDVGVLRMELPTAPILNWNKFHDFMDQFKGTLNNRELDDLSDVFAEQLKQIQVMAILKKRIR